MAGGLDTNTIQLLAQLLSGARGANKNLSGIMNNADNPVLLALAGVLDPMYGQNAQSGELYGQFAGDASTPLAVKSVMDWVDQGMNKYQIEAKINSLPGNVKTDSGYTDQQLISMGAEMAKQRASSPSNVFAKAGLRNPNDVYNISDQPMSASNQALYNQYLDRANAMVNDVNLARSKADKAKVELQKTTGNQATYVIPQDAAISARKILMGNTYNAPLVHLYHKITNQLAPGKDVVLTESDLAALPRDQNVYKILSKSGKKKVDVEAWKKQQAALMDVADVERKAAAEANRAMAVAQGNLQGVAAAGRTPFSDQMAGLMRFLGASK